MTNRIRQLLAAAKGGLTRARAIRVAAVAVAATTLASAAFVLGSQTDGSAIGAVAGAERGDGRGHHGHHGPDLAALATRLGVPETRLRTAFEEVRSENDADRPDRDARRQAMTNALAKELGVTPARLQTALDRTFDGRDRPGGRGEPGMRPDANAMAAELARALNLEQAKVKAALDKVRAAHEAEHEQRRRQMATALAQKLDLPAAKVQQALEAMPDGRHGRP